MTDILITGINGFIGSRFADVARARGWTIVGSDLAAHDVFGKSDRYVSLDLGSVRAEDLREAVGRVDFILHAGGVSGFMVAADQPERIAAINVGGTTAILEWARRAGCRRLVLCSTIMVYGPDAPGSGPRSESEALKPITVYGASKAAVEGLMHGYHGQYGVDAVALRFSHVYGPGRTTECFIREMMQAAAERRSCTIPQAAGSPRQYVHIDDVCRAIDLALAVDEPSERVFNISAGEIHRLDEVAAALRDATGALQVGFDESRDLLPYRIGALSISRARDILGYGPQWPLREGLRRYWESSFVPAPPAAHPL